MEWLTLPPLLLPFAGVVFSLMTRKRRALQSGLALTIMLLALVSTSALTWVVLANQNGLVLHPGLWPAPIGITLAADPLTVFMLLMTYLVLTAGILYALGSTEKVVQYPAFYPLFFGLATGLSGAFLTGDLLNLFVFTEIIVITGTALTGIADDEFGIEAAYKYILISTVASTFFLLAIGALYAVYAFLTKSAVFPFHFWQPDFHAAAPTPVSAMLSSVVVKVGVYGLLRMTSLLFASQADTLRPVLMLLGMVGVVYGGFGAAGTHNVKRMLAYSTLSQIGFILVGMGWGTPLSITAALVFAFNHALVKSAMLMLSGAMASRAAVKSASFEVVAGVGKDHPFAGALFLLGGMALAGIPPTNGFLSKLGIFWSGIEAAQYLPLAIIGVASVLTLFYVISAFIKIWFEQKPAVKPKQGDFLLAPALLIGLCLLLGIWGEPLIVFAQTATAWINTPANYVTIILK